MQLSGNFYEAYFDKHFSKAFMWVRILTSLPAKPALTYVHNFSHEKGSCAHVNAYVSKTVIPNYKLVEILSFSVDILYSGAVQNLW